MRPARDLDGLARELRGLAPSCGPVRLVAVDGHAGSGKTGFSARLARALDGAPVLHLDDVASHDALFDWTVRVRSEVIGPLSRGVRARYGVYDWHRREFTRAGELPPHPVVLVEGVGAGRRALRPWLAAVLWMDLPRAESWARGMRRDGMDQADFWRHWKQAERAHFRADPTRPYARYVVRERGEGHEVLEGPAGSG
jgi:uridine kinase